jgi:Ca-activated chloride channel family protein
VFEFAFMPILLVLPLPLLLWWWQHRDQPISARLWLPFAQRWRDAQASVRHSPQHAWRSWLWPFLVWTLLVLAAAQPQWVGEPIANQRSGRDLMLVVDLSGSMEATDLVKLFP